MQPTIIGLGWIRVRRGGTAQALPMSSTRLPAHVDLIREGARPA
jgi:hypothetical protein